MSGFQCEACGCQRIDGDVRYSVSYDEEHLDGEAYTVTKSMEFMSLCPTCFNRFNIASKVDAELSRELSNKSDHLPNMAFTDPDQSMYDCCRCGSMIQDGNTICSVYHSLAFINGNSVRPINTTISNVMCETCANSVEYESMVQDVTARIMANVRR
jgi:hypothetical protein